MGEVHVYGDEAVAERIIAWLEACTTCTRVHDGDEDHPYRPRNRQAAQAVRRYLRETGGE